MKHSIGKISLVIVALGGAFWIGRISTPEAVNEVEQANQSSDSGTRSSRRSSGNGSSPGAGESAITSTLQLRELYKHGDSTQAAITLSKMNTAELSSLAQDLAESYVGGSGYMISTELAAFSQWAETDPDAALKFALSSKQTSFKAQAVRSIFQKLAKIDPDLANVKLADIADLRLKREMKGIYYQSIATTQPDEWLQAVRSDASLAQRTHMPSILAQWAADDPVAAVARISQLPVSLQLKGVAAFGEKWSAKDPQAAMAWAQSLSRPGLKNKALAAVVGGMAAHDSDAAIAALDTLPSSSRRAGLAAIFKTLANRDFDTALAQVSNLPDPVDQKIAYKEMLANSNYYARLDTSQITELMKQLPTGSLRNEAINQLGNRLAQFNPKDAEVFLKGFSEQEQLKIQLKMINGLSHYQPIRAMEIYQSLPSEKTEYYTFSNIVRNIAISDPEAALQLVMKEESAYKQLQSVGSVFSGLAASDPEGAAQRLEEIPEGKLRIKAMESFVGTWAKTDPDAAVRWADRLPDGEKNKAYLSILPEMARSTPQDAAHLLDNLLTTSSSKSGYSGVVYNIMNTWSKDDPTSAATWALSLQDESMQSRAVKKLASSWYQEDTNGVADWIDQLPDGKNRDASISSISSSLRRRDPSAAFAWAESIGSEKSRMSALSSVVRSWKDYDQKAARKMVETANLSNDERTSLLKSLE